MLGYILAIMLPFIIIFVLLLLVELKDRNRKD